MTAPIDKNTPITIGLVILVLTVSGTAIFKAGQVLTEIDYMKAGIVEIRANVSDMQRTLNAVERQQRDTARNQKANQ